MMRQRLMQVLGSEDDGEMTDVVRRFWTRAKPLPACLERRPDAQVVDLAHWARAHRDAAR